jgi:hypothetical protein
MTWMNDDGPHRKNAAGSMMLERWYDDIGTPKGFTIRVHARRHYALLTEVAQRPTRSSFLSSTQLRATPILTKSLYIS